MISKDKLNPWRPLWAFKKSYKSLNLSNVGFEILDTETNEVFKFKKSDWNYGRGLCPLDGMFATYHPSYEEYKSVDGDDVERLYRHRPLNILVFRFENTKYQRYLVAKENVKVGDLVYLVGTRGSPYRRVIRIEGTRLFGESYYFDRRSKKFVPQGITSDNCLSSVREIIMWTEDV